jgi:hypothetical protein
MAHLNCNNTLCLGFERLHSACAGIEHVLMKSHPPIG